MILGRRNRKATKPGRCKSGLVALVRLSVKTPPADVVDKGISFCFEPVYPIGGYAICSYAISGYAIGSVIFLLVNC